MKSYSVGVPQGVSGNNSVHSTAAIVKTVPTGVNDNARGKQIVLDNFVVGVPVQIDHFHDLPTREVSKPSAAPVVSEHWVTDHRPSYCTNPDVLQCPIFTGRLNIEHTVVIVCHIYGEIFNSPGGGRVVCVNVARTRSCVRIILPKEDGDQLSALAD
jgi:hypothetical protein